MSWVSRSPGMSRSPWVSRSSRSAGVSRSAGMSLSRHDLSRHDLSRVSRSTGHHHARRSLSRSTGVRLRSTARSLHLLGTRGSSGGPRSTLVHPHLTRVGTGHGDGWPSHVLRRLLRSPRVVRRVTRGIPEGRPRWGAGSPRVWGPHPPRPQTRGCQGGGRVGNRGGGLGTSRGEGCNRKRQATLQTLFCF